MNINKKQSVLFIWLFLSLIYIFTDLYQVSFISLRVNLWVQLSITSFVLASTGAILQKILYNPIADPWILGVTGASSLGTVVVSLLQLTPILFWRTLASLSFSMVVIVFLFIISLKNRFFNINFFILIGLGINSLSSSLIIFLQSIIAPNDFFTTLVRISGHFVQRSPIELLLLLFSCILTMIFLHRRNKELSILSVGDELATTVGVSTIHIKYEAIIVCTIVLALVVSMSGSIGFIGLATAHIIRMSFGEKEVLSVELLFLVSGILILLASLLVRLLPMGVFVPIGSAMSLIGAPMFIYILLKNNKNY